MPRLQTVHDCQRQLQHLLPVLSRPLQRSVAALTSGIVESGSCTLNRAAASLPTTATVPSTERRFQRLLANPGFDVAACQAVLTRQVLSERSGRLDLLLDATTTGATAHQAGTQTLVLALGERQRAIPLTWQCWSADAVDQAWGQMQSAFFAQVDALRPADTEVVVMADRGLSGAPLVRRLQEHGWHYLLRVVRTTRVRLADGQVVEIGDLASHPGTATMLAGVQVYAPRRKPGRRRVRDWEQAVTTNVVAVWRPGDPEPWLLVTDLPAERRRCQEYRRRTWEELLFRDLKGMGWGWERSRVRDPERVARLLLVLLLATLWMLALGSRVIRNGWRTRLEPRTRRCFSRFQLGRHWLVRLRAREQPVPCYFTCYPVTRAPVKLS